MHPVGSLFVGGVAGAVFVYMFQVMQDRLKIDDVLGVWPLHGVAGAWGGIAAGIFGQEVFGGLGGVSFGAQVLGTLIGVLYAFILGLVLYGGLKALVGHSFDPRRRTRRCGSVDPQNPRQSGSRYFRVTGFNKGGYENAWASGDLDNYQTMRFRACARYWMELNRVHRRFLSRLENLNTPCPISFGKSWPAKSMALAAIPRMMARLNFAKPLAPGCKGAIAWIRASLIPCAIVAAEWNP